MSGARPFQGSLFAEDFLLGSIKKLPDWERVTDAALDEIHAKMRALFVRFPAATSPNESQTEDDLIWPVLRALGWSASLRQQNLSPRGREHVPDGLLFQDNAAKDHANSFFEEWKRYALGLAIVESKRWARPLDRRSGYRGEETAPSTQMLRYLRRVDDLSEGGLRWGILANGQYWRLYWQGALSVSEQFFEIDLAAILDLPGHNDGLFVLDAEERRHWLKVFVLVFGQNAFLPDPADGQTFHRRAIDEGRFYQQRVSASLSEVVFGEVFPSLAGAIAKATPDAPLEEVREAALILLYRLLFILYAEDRDLLPVRDTRYDDYGVRDKVRGDVGRRKDKADVFSRTASRYWSAFDDLCRAIDVGDTSIGLPPYNGGLFDRQRTPLLCTIRLGDAVMADVIDALSFEQVREGRRYINYRDLGVQQLGSIYERLLEQELVRDGEALAVRPNIFARKNTGSYYTPDDLVGLIVRETMDPLIQSRLDAFTAEATDRASSALPEDRRMGRLKRLDPAEKILELKVCDPAMGSGHFLVNLVDHLSDRVIAAMAEAEAAWEGYLSPLNERIENIRNTIIGNAEMRGWTVDPGQLDDRHIVRRMVLKRCVYGVDKNPMAVELAKVSLWLHTFTVGAPLSFLDHHLRCGDSLFGAWVKPSLDKAEQHGGPIFLRAPLARATRAAAPMQIIEGLTDAEVAEAHRSADVFAEVSEMTAPLNAFLSLFRAFEWMDIRDLDDRKALQFYLDGQYGDPVAIALGTTDPNPEAEEANRFQHILQTARQLVVDERYLHWQVAFPGVWSDWEKSGRHGGFDAVIGNPPWDRMKLQQVEWFAARRPEIAMAPRAANRKRMIAELQNTRDPLWEDFAVANKRTGWALRIARKGGDYPLLGRGDINLYSLFVERAMTLVKSEGMVGLLTPSGIAADKTAAKFFKQVATQGRLRALYDFENKKVFFPDVHASFKFCVLVASPSKVGVPANCAFYLHNVAEIDDPDRCFPLSAEDFARVNPNTGTAPIFRTRRDADLTTAIYSRLPVLVNRSSGEAVKAWPVKYSTMFHMTNDSGLFRTEAELVEQEGAWPIRGNRFNSPSGKWVPLYVGRMIHQFDHRAASVVVNKDNLHNPALSGDIATQQKADPKFSPVPQYWVAAAELSFPDETDWTIAFRDIARSSDARTMIPAAIPRVGIGNTLPALLVEATHCHSYDSALLLANLGAIVFDFVVRQKAQSTHLNWYIVEQLPVVPPKRYAVRFGPKTVAEIVREAVLELTYTAYDMAPFARDMGHVDDLGEVLPPFRWNEVRRLNLRAKLDATYFHLYGITERDDIRHIYSTFPIVERQEQESYGSFRSRDLCLAYINALSAGEPDAELGP